MSKTVCVTIVKTITLEDDEGVELSEVKPVEKTIVVKSWEYV